MPIDPYLKLEAFARGRAARKTAPRWPPARCHRRPRRPGRRRSRFPRRLRTATGAPALFRREGASGAGTQIFSRARPSPHPRTQRCAHVPGEGAHQGIAYRGTPASAAGGRAEVDAGKAEDWKAAGSSFRMDQRREERKHNICGAMRRKSGVCASVGHGNQHAGLALESVRRRALETAWSMHEATAPVAHRSSPVSGMQETSMPSRPHATRPGSGRWNNGPSTTVVSVSRRVRNDEHRESLRQRLLAQAREQRELEEAREAQRRAAAGEAIARLKRRAPVTLTGKAQRQIVR